MEIQTHTPYHPRSQKVPVERYDVFDVMQLTRGTPLQNRVAADWVSIGPHQVSNVHRHNRSETVLFIIQGQAEARVGDRRFEVRTGDQVVIRAGEFHGFVTQADPLVFLSVQTPPIFDETTGVLDLEPEPNT